MGQILKARQAAMDAASELSRAVMAARPQAMEDAARAALEAASNLADTIRETPHTTEAVLGSRYN